MSNHSLINNGSKNKNITSNMNYSNTKSPPINNNNQKKSKNKNIN